MTWHFTITSEMRDLGLKGNELLVYAIVAGYSANGQGCYFGSIPYLAELCGVSYGTAFNCLKSLTAQGLLLKKEEINNGVKSCQYTTAKDAVVLQILQGGTTNFAGNNKSYNKDIPPVVDKSTTPPQGVSSPKTSDIKQLFLNDGCAADDLRDWVTARKGAKITEAVYKGMKREAAKAGITLAEAVRICAENSWRGFRAEYLERSRKTTAGSQQGSTFMGDIQRTYDKLAAGWAARAAQMEGGQR